MRIIGHIPSEDSARLFGDYLYAKGIDNQIEFDSGDQWAVWVHAEDRLEESNQLLSSFLSNPKDRQFTETAKDAEQLREQRDKENDAYLKKMRDRKQLFKKSQIGGTGIGAFTLGIIITCAIVALITRFGAEEAIVRKLLISNFRQGGGSIGLPEVMRGEVWRLFTPILMHGGWIHIIFNMWWMKDLGSMIEMRQGWRWLLLLVLTTGAVANVAQYYVSGPLFFGMSGVVFGLFGYIWMKSKLDPGSGYFMHQNIVFIMLIILIIGYTGFLDGIAGGKIANTNHSAGLVAGMAWGYLTSVKRMMS